MSRRLYSLKDVFRDFSYLKQKYTTILRIFAEKIWLWVYVLSGIFLKNVIYLGIITVGLESFLSGGSPTVLDYIIVSLVVIPISKIVSSFFIAYYNMFDFIRVNLSPFIKNRTPPYDGSPEKIKLETKNVDPKTIWYKSRSWWWYGHLLTAAWILVVLILDRIDQTEFLKSLSTIILKLFEVLFPINLLVVPFSDYLSGTSDQLNVFVVIIFFPAIFYMIPMANRIDMNIHHIRTKIGTGNKLRAMLKNSSVIFLALFLGGMFALVLSGI